LAAPLKCQCGKMKGRLTKTSSSLGRIVCYCDDCQAYAHYLGRAKDILNSNGGTDIFPARPVDLQIVSGIENLGCMRLSSKGMYRWFAVCCNSPIGNSISNSKIPHVGLHTSFIDLSSEQLIRTIGPVQYHVQGKYGIGELPSYVSRSAPPVLILRTIRFLLSGWLKRQFRPSPFFDSNGKPRVAPRVMSPVERDELRKYCGPNPHSGKNKFERKGG
jgi:hypothetical protein